MSSSLNDHFNAIQHGSGVNKYNINYYIPGSALNDAEPICKYITGENKCTANTHKIIIVKSSMEIRMSQLKMKKYRCKLIDRWEGEEL